MTSSPRARSVLIAESPERALRSVAETPDFKTFGPKNTKIFYESLDGCKALQAPTNFNICEPIVNKTFEPIFES